MLLFIYLFSKSICGCFFGFANKSVYSGEAVPGYRSEHLESQERGLPTTSEGDALTALDGGIKGGRTGREWRASDDKQK